MRIANPIYDVVFKYMMNDNKVAKLLLSAIIGEEIEELEFRPTEYRGDLEAKTLTVFRMDFSARIKTPEGARKTVVIEIQKAKFHTDIMRFRKYLAAQYADKENSLVDERGHRRAYPIISVYFLGHRLDHVRSSIVKVNRRYFDGVTKKEITEREEFIECLTHDSFVIQIPELSHKRRNELEEILAIFDQTSGEGEKPHELDIDEDAYPAKYRPLTRALVKAVSEPKVRKEMDAEDDFVETLENLERAAARKDQIIEEKEQALSEKEQALSEKEQALMEKDQALMEKDQALMEKDQVLMEKDLMIAELLARVEKGSM